MFRNRPSSQTLGDELIAKFRQSFPEVGIATSTAGSSAVNAALGKLAAGGPRIESLGGDDTKNLNSTPRTQHEPFRFTPSLLDPNSVAFYNFANQPPGYHTPTPGATNAPNHNNAGGLHIFGMGIGKGLGTPLLLPTSADDLHTSTVTDIFAFSHHMPPQVHNYDPFGQPHSQPNQEAQQHEQSQQLYYAPSSFVYHDNGLETMEHEESSLDGDGRMGSLDATMQDQSPIKMLQPAHFDMGGSHASLPRSAQKVRFHVTLNAPTAMIKQADEIPITYLNKRQAYSIYIVDTAPNLGQPPWTRYRTVVRISFEDEQQWQGPAACWQLWKEGRGTHEAHQRGGKLQAVEYVEVSQPAESDDKRTRVDLDTASFDGFSVIWTPGVNGSADCNLAVRFNFLSTDFSHSKGVKGIPVRLCAKTETYGTGTPRSVQNSEVAFCRIKLFRDHGAERKLSHDVAHVKKTIDKLKQQISQAETGMKDLSKRRRAGSISTKAQPSHRPGKVQKLERTRSMSSASSAGGTVPAEDDLHYKLQKMQDMFTSTRPVSILYLRGAEEDDPDLHPVTLVGESLDLTKVDSRGSAVWQQRSDRSSTSGTASLVSSSPSSISLQSQAVVVPAPQGATAWADFQSMAPAEMQSSTLQRLASLPDQRTKVTRRDESGSFSDWIEALGVDNSYNPPAERSIKPVACFYILHRNSTKAKNPEYYQTIYLMQRTLKDFTEAIAAKWHLEPNNVQRTLHVLDRGLQIEMDDDVIRELDEGQDIIMEMVPTQNLVKREWEMSVDVTIDSDNTSGAQNVIHTEGYELRLMY